MSARKEDNINVVRHWFEAFREEGADALFAIYDELAAPEFEWRGGPAGRDMVGGDVTYRGLDGLRQYFEEIDRVVSWWRFEPPEFEPLGDRVVLVRAQLRLIWRGSEVELDQEMAFVYRLEGGRVIAGEAFRSPADAEAAARRLAEEPVDA